MVDGSRSREGGGVEVILPVKVLPSHNVTTTERAFFSDWLAFQVPHSEDCALRVGTRPVQD